MKEFYIQLNFRNGSSILEGPFSEYIATHFLTDIPRRQAMKDGEYVGIASAIKVDAKDYQEKLEKVKRNLFKGGDS